MLETENKPISKPIITMSPLATENPLLRLRTDRIIDTTPLQVAEVYVSPNLPPTEKYGVEAIRELIVMVVAIIGIVINNANVKTIWQLALKPFEVLKALKALYDAGSFVIKKYKLCYLELSDISKEEAWLLMNILVSELKTVLGNPIESK